MVILRYCFETNADHKPHGWASGGQKYSCPGNYRPARACPNPYLHTQHNWANPGSRMGVSYRCPGISDGEDSPVDKYKKDNNRERMADVPIEKVDPPITENTIKVGFAVLESDRYVLEKAIESYVGQSGVSTDDILRRANMFRTWLKASAKQ